MSIGAFRWALNWVGLSSAEKFVLVMIADHYNEKCHRSWPSIALLADETSLSRATVKRAIKNLAFHEVIAVEPWKQAGTGHSLNNRYLLPLYDKKSKPAVHLPVIAKAEFDANGNRVYDTTPHRERHEERVPTLAA